MLLSTAIFLLLSATGASAGCIDQSPLPEGNPDVADSPFTFPNKGGSCPLFPSPFDYDLFFPNQTSDEGIVVVYNDEYPTNASSFKLICEELWACTKYNEQFLDLDADSSQLSMCFDSAPGGICAPFYYLDDEDHEFRKSFVVKTCFGAGERNFNGTARPIACEPDDCDGYDESLTSLKDSVCGTAEVLAERLQFITENETLCTEIIDCLIDDFIPTITDQFEPDTEFSKDDLKPDLCDGNQTELETKADQFCNLLANNTGGDCVEETIPQGSAPSCGSTSLVPALPTCPADNEAVSKLFKDFGPGYPACSDGCEGYEITVATIRKTLISCDDNRTDAFLYTLFLGFKAIFQAIIIPLKNIMDGLPESPVGLAPTVYVLEVLIFSMDTVLSQADFHDGLIDGAEVEAFYENTRQLLNGSASIYDEVVCRCVEDKRRGHGCDSVDNNCNQTVDECDEDGFPPEIDIGQALCQCGPGGCGERPKWFTNNTDPVKCVKSTTIVEDDCDNNATVEFQLIGKCFDSFVQIESEDRCGNIAMTKQVGVFLDEEDPVPSCSFGEPDPTAKIKSISDSSGKILLVRNTGAGVQHNVDLKYGATDSCEGEIDVKVDVFANEIEDFQSQKMALFFQTAHDIEEKVGLFVATTVCDVSTNGQCVKDPARGPDNSKDFRLYTIVVTATDESGRSAKEECKIIIVPQPTNLSQVPDVFLGNTTQRFLLVSHTSKLNGDKNMGVARDLSLNEPKVDAAKSKVVTELTIQVAEDTMKKSGGTAKNIPNMVLSLFVVMLSYTWD